METHLRGGICGYISRTYVSKWRYLQSAYLLLRVLGSLLDAPWFCGDRFLSNWRCVSVSVFLDSLGIPSRSMFRSLFFGHPEHPIDMFSKVSIFRPRIYNLSHWMFFQSCNFRAIMLHRVPITIVMASLYKYRPAFLRLNPIRVPSSHWDLTLLLEFRFRLSTTAPGKPFVLVPILVALYAYHVRDVRPPPCPPTMVNTRLFFFCAAMWTYRMIGSLSSSTWRSPLQNHAAPRCLLIIYVRKNSHPLFSIFFYLAHRKRFPGIK